MADAKSVPSLEDEVLDDFVEAARKLLALPVDPAWIPGIRSNLATALTMANFVADFSLPDGADPAPRYDPENG
jgi:1-carboxybiuret hydrolase subunit AtzG-like protein